LRDRLKIISTHHTIDARFYTGIYSESQRLICQVKHFGVAKDNGLLLSHAMVTVEASIFIQLGKPGPPSGL
jgi:hypothetical protein